MDQTPTGFDRVIIITEEWVDASQSFGPSQATSCMKDDNAKRVARPETIHYFNGCRNFNSRK
jgi:hypothetical protein